MATLDYQRGEDHRDERRRERLRALGVVDYGAAWEAFARETGAEYLPTKWPMAPGKVVSRVGPWTLLLESVGGENAHETCLRADFSLLVPFRSSGRSGSLTSWGNTCGCRGRKRVKRCSMRTS